MGRLREARHSSKYADIIIVSKCPMHLSNEDAQRISSEIHNYAPGCKILFTSITYPDPQAVNHNQSIRPNITLVTGIADPVPLVQFVRSKYHLTKHLQYKDHHTYSPGEVSYMVERCQKSDSDLITTSKDWVRLRDFDALDHINVFVQPMSPNFLFDGEIVLSEAIAANQ